MKVITVHILLHHHKDKTLDCSSLSDSHFNIPFYLCSLSMIISMKYHIVIKIGYQYQNQTAAAFLTVTQ